MKLSTQLQYAEDPKAGAAQIVELEKAGLDLVWVAEAYSFDAVSLMGYLAATTERVEIGAGILPIYSRTPTLVGMSAAGIDALSGGRMVLGLGSSGPQVIEGFHGVPFDRPITRTREIVDICRQVWRREKVDHHGVYDIPLTGGTGLGKPLKIINRPVRDRIPIWVAALGDKNVEMTAEIAEGWLPHVVVPERMEQAFGDTLRAGFAKRDPALGPLQMTGGGIVALEEEMFEPARQAARGLYALYVGGMGARGKNFYNTVMQRQGWADEAKLVQDLYLDGRKEEAAAALPAEFIEQATLIGPPAFVKERIAALGSVGVTHLQVNPVTRNPVKIMEQMRELAP
jgi:F420-dependent oxidoreductase-like protein